VASPGLCIDSYGRDEHSQLGLFHCADDLENPQQAQFFTLRYYRDVELKGTMFCLDQDENGRLSTAICHHAQGNQYFRYNMDSRQIFHGSKDRRECVDMNPSQISANSVFLTKCDEDSLSQKWIWGFMNETALRNWVTSGSDIIDKREVSMLKEESE
jgi:hypothetical protein